MGRQRNVELATLKELPALCRELGRVERRRDEAILQARLAGNSLRVIADSTGLSHETVRAIVERMQEWVREETAELEAVKSGWVAPEHEYMERQRERRAEHLRKLLNVKIPDS
jgi:hypothetical protein